MRILVTIPHFFGKAGVAAYGSESGNAQKRINALNTAALSLKQTFGHEQAHMNAIRYRCNGGLSAKVDIVICTDKTHHIVSHLQTDLFDHQLFDCDPRLLGYECHNVLVSNLGKYDYYCFLEDDLKIVDPMFFVKLSWFSKSVGNDSLLQPHRFELDRHRPIRKLYIDSKLSDPSLSAKFQDRQFRPNLQGTVLGQTVNFERMDNPHSGCFFLNEDQMREWASRPYFLDRSSDFAGPLESSATLGIMKTFNVYKPSIENAGFLEIEHLDRRYLNNRLKLPSDFTVLSS